MHILIEQWRALAAEADPIYASALRVCADDLEQAWHDDYHDAAWSPELCKICVKEMAENQ